MKSINLIGGTHMQWDEICAHPPELIAFFTAVKIALFCVGQFG